MAQTNNSSVIKRKRDHSIPETFMTELTFFGRPDQDFRTSNKYFFLWYNLVLL